MAWFAWFAAVWSGASPTGPVPGVMQYGTGLLQWVAAGTAIMPVLLVVRQALRARSDAIKAPRLRVLEGGRELRQRAA
jgi:hypothetical protein